MSAYHNNQKRLRSIERSQARKSAQLAQLKAFIIKLPEYRAGNISLSQLLKP